MKKMLINEADDESRIAIIEDNILQEMLIEHLTSERIKNNIYKGTIVQIQSSLQAAFVDFGNKKHGFLPNTEINPDLFPNKNFKKNESIQKKVKKGQQLLVQVTREAVDNKGAALTTNISLPGRFMVFMSHSNKGGISKKIDNPEERDRLKSFLSGIEAEEHAVIIRTAGIGRNLAELKKDYTTLKKTWEEIQKKYKSTEKPGLILEEPDVVSRTLRDYYTEDIEEIWVDNAETFKKALVFLKQFAPRRQKNLKLFVGDRSLFATYRIERQVEQLTSNDVQLKSGGSIVIDQTEALVAIDVNSGRSNQEGSIDSTAIRTNLEAADEIARQLRLRNLGGLIVIDFIDMEQDESKRKVEEKLEQAMERDKAQLRFSNISQFGLLELSRQRLAVGISNTVERKCPTCNGKGRIPSLLAASNIIIRSIREMAAKGNLELIEGELSFEMVNHLLNERRQSITDLELEFGVKISLKGSSKIQILNDYSLRPVFVEKTRKKENDSPPRVEPTQGEQGRKKRNRSEKEVTTKQERVSKEKKVADKKQIEKDKPSPPAKEEKKPKMDRREIVETSDKSRNSDKDDSIPPIEPNDDTTIHPSCLFSDVKDLPEDELDEITTSFENRLKGKVDNAIPQKIDTKYLWKNSSEKDNPVNSADVGLPTPSLDNAAENLDAQEAIEPPLPQDAPGKEETEIKKGTRKTSSRTRKTKTAKKKSESGRSEEKNTETSKNSSSNTSKAKSEKKPKKTPSPKTKKVSAKGTEKKPVKKTAAKTASSKKTTKSTTGRKKTATPKTDKKEPKK